MSDWIGLAFFLILIIGAVVGLKLVSRPRVRTTEEFEKKAAEGSTALGASMNALQELLNPEAAKGKEVAVQLKEGRFDKKKSDGKTKEQ